MNKKIAVFAISAALSIIFVVMLYRLIFDMASRARTPAPDISKTAATISKPAEREDAYWRLASICEKKQDLLKLKNIYQQILEEFPSSNNVLKAQEALENTNVRLLFSDIQDPDSFIYRVEKGDGLAKIAKKFNTTVELILRANGLKDGVLRYGRKLKITKLRFSIVVDKSQNILTLKADDKIFKTYRVSTGKDSSTPVGSFKIITKIINPPWYPAKGKAIPSGDPKNVLGSRWLGISKPSYGIHGTIDPASIGKSVTEGCVRMKNIEVEELYSIVPEGTEVVIVD
ncbi:MAG: L,D-transpeptidase family protein [Candidatus Omnitrophica bacterium]|nr:L,D-transpeptidase family protein [Candidatus Omnitrophota bacterium]